MRWLVGFWASLTDEGQARRLVLLGSAFAFVATGAWQIYQWSSAERDPTAPAAEVVADPAPSLPTESRHVGRDGSSIETVVDTRGDFSGDTGVIDSVIECAEGARISSSAAVGGDFSGSNIVKGIRITGVRSADCE